MGRLSHVSFFSLLASLTVRVETQLLSRCGAAASSCADASAQSWSVWQSGLILLQSSVMFLMFSLRSCICSWKTPVLRDVNRTWRLCDATDHMFRWTPGEHSYHAASGRHRPCCRPHKTTMIPNRSASRSPAGTEGPLILQKWRGGAWRHILFHRVSHYCREETGNRAHLPRRANRRQETCTKETRLLQLAMGDKHPQPWSTARRPVMLHERLVGQQTRTQSSFKLSFINNQQQTNSFSRNTETVTIATTSLSAA